MPHHSSATSCRIVRVDSRSVGPADSAGPGDELVLLIEIAPADARHSLAVEVYRGAERRSAWRCAIEPSTETTVLAHRLRWSDRPDASQRLTCRVFLDGLLVDTPTVLLAPAADAQGRLKDPLPAAMSEQTRLAYTDAFSRLLGQSPEKEQRGRRTS